MKWQQPTVARNTQLGRQVALGHHIAGVILIITMFVILDILAAGIERCYNNYTRGKKQKQLRFLAVWSSFICQLI